MPTFIMTSIRKTRQLVCNKEINKIKSMLLLSNCNWFLIIQMVVLKFTCQIKFIFYSSLTVNDRRL